MSHTKIVCTIGPATKTKTTLKKLIRAGMNVARLNFSHGTHEDHAKLIENIRLAAADLNKTITILGDLQGPKIRLGKLPKEIALEAGQRITLTTEGEYKKDVFPVTYSGLHNDVKKGQRIFVNDGVIELKVVNIRGSRIACKVISPGPISSHKGMNFPDSDLSVSSITKKDKKDLAFALEQNVDWIALSFVTSPREVTRLRSIIEDATLADRPDVIVKIEKEQAVEQFSKILEVADGIMIARGDLGIEIPQEEVPIHQKEMVEACRNAGKPVIVATQMLDSMIRNPRPTRAEVSDVANAVIDHADGVMLSGETATGAYPVEAVRTMREIILETEGSKFDDVPDQERSDNTYIGLGQGLNHLVHTNQIHSILVSSLDEDLMRAANLFRPQVPIFAFCESEFDMRRINIRWGVVPVFKANSEISSPEQALRHVRKHGLIGKTKRTAILFNGADGPAMVVR